VKNDGFDLLSKECPNAQVSCTFEMRENLEV
jgi:hypothetical protein